MLVVPKEPQEVIQLASLVWMKGKWINKIDSDIIEEHWETILCDSMPGWFRWKKNESIFLYEFMLFQEIGDQVILKIKHFTANFEGWEKKDAWTEYRAWFTEPDRIVLKATKEEHTPWFVYELKNSKLYATFYDKNKKQTDQFVFNQVV